MAAFFICEEPIKKKQIGDTAMTNEKTARLEFGR